MTIYCRGCNQEFKVASETKTEYVDEKGHRHPKVDCDKL
jgi:hypothetical protein